MVSSSHPEQPASADWHGSTAGELPLELLECTLGLSLAPCRTPPALLALCDCDTTPLLP